LEYTNFRSLASQTVAKPPQPNLYKILYLPSLKVSPRCVGWYSPFRYRLNSSASTSQWRHSAAFVIEFLESYVEAMWCRLTVDLKFDLEHKSCVKGSLRHLIDDRYDDIQLLLVETHQMGLLLLCLFEILLIIGSYLSSFNTRSARYLHNLKWLSSPVFTQHPSPPLAETIKGSIHWFDLNLIISSEDPHNIETHLQKTSAARLHYYQRATMSGRVPIVTFLQNLAMAVWSTPDCEHFENVFVK